MNDRQSVVFVIALIRIVVVIFIISINVIQVDLREIRGYQSIYCFNVNVFFPWRECEYICMLAVN